MDRRSFLSRTAGAAAWYALAGKRTLAAPARDRLRLSITWGMMGKTPAPEALGQLDKLGYDGFEMFNWRDAATLATFADERKKHKLECACLVANKGVSAPGCGLVNPKERDAFLTEINSAIAAAQKVDCKRLVVLTGNEVPGMTRDAQMESCVAGLKAAAPILERSGIAAIVEILNTYVDHKGYFLYRVRDGVDMMERVGSPNVKLLFDIYHVQIMEGNLIQNIRNHIKQIAHFHVGDVPGRHQPGTGEINYRNVFKAIYDLGYDGFVSPEYRPTVPLLENLAEVRRMTTFG
jgi:hydroxypyruvate isomerase